MITYLSSSLPSHPPPSPLPPSPLASHQKRMQEPLERYFANGAPLPIDERRVPLHHPAEQYAPDGHLRLVIGRLRLPHHRIRRPIRPL